jgi:DNA polymerase-3 subunit epsilon
VAVDIETANPSMASICQVGVAGFSDGAVSFEWVSYVDPQDCFAPMNVAVHGIDAPVVAGAPLFPAIANQLLQMIGGTVVACHTPFDRVALHQAFTKHALELPALTWLDTARVARRAWAECAHRGYGLATVCSMIGYDFQHHDALEDAKAAGEVLLAACKATGLSVDDWLVRVEQSISGEPRKRSGGWRKESYAQEGNPDGPLVGEIIVFTGSLHIPRREAAEKAAGIGCEVADVVTKKTTLLVVGDQDATRLSGHEKSSKHRKAENLIEKGHAIRILRESDFLQLVELEE